MCFCVCLNCRVGVCGICSPGQHLVPVVTGDLLVSVLPSLLLLLRPLLLLSRHLLLSTTLSVMSSFHSARIPSASYPSRYMRGSLFFPFSQCMRQERWQRADHPLRFLCIPTTSPVCLLWFPSPPHLMWIQRSPPSPQWRPTWPEVSVHRDSSASGTAYLTRLTLTSSIVPHLRVCL